MSNYYLPKNILDSMPKPNSITWFIKLRNIIHKEDTKEIHIYSKSANRIQILSNNFEFHFLTK